MREIDKKAIPFLKNKGYGKGTNYTTDLVASLMLQFSKEQGQELPTNSFELDDGTICCCSCERRKSGINLD